MLSRLLFELWFFSFSVETPPFCAATRSVEESEDQHRCHRTVCLKTDEEPVELHAGDHTTTDEEDAGVCPISYALHQGVVNAVFLFFRCDIH